MNVAVAVQNRNNVRILGPSNAPAIVLARLGEGRDRYGRDRLRAFVAEHARLDAAGLIAALTGLLGDLGDGVVDDVALPALSVDR